MVKFILMLMLAPLLCFANPAPFGLEIGKMTVQEFKEKYQYKYEGENKFSKGEMFEINPKTINFEGLKKIYVIFNQDKILVAIRTELPDYKFDDILKMLESKYKLIDKNIQFGSTKFAIFSENETQIELEKIFSDMHLDYSLVSFVKSMKSQQAKELKEIQQQESSQL
jgi:hypothetical protein